MAVVATPTHQVKYLTTEKRDRQDFQRIPLAVQFTGPALSDLATQATALVAVLQSAGVLLTPYNQSLVLSRAEKTAERGFVEMAGPPTFDPTSATTLKAGFNALIDQLEAYGVIAESLGSTRRVYKMTEKTRDVGTVMIPAVADFVGANAAAILLEAENLVTQLVTVGVIRLS
jgi:hypothetical protein